MDEVTLITNVKALVTNALTFSMDEVTLITNVKALVNINAIASAAGCSFQIAPRPLDLVGVDVTITLIALMQRIASGETI
jgi:hypothetical protein